MTNNYMFLAASGISQIGPIFKGEFVYNRPYHDLIIKRIVKPETAYDTNISAYQIFSAPKLILMLINLNRDKV